MTDYDPSPPPADMPPHLWNNSFTRLAYTTLANLGPAAAFMSPAALAAHIGEAIERQDSHSDRVAAVIAATLHRAIESELGWTNRIIIPGASREARDETLKELVMSFTSEIIGPLFLLIDYLPTDPSADLWNRVVD